MNNLQTITLGLTHTIHTWKLTLRAYAKSPSPLQALLLYNRFFKSPSLPPFDSHTFPPLFKACSLAHSLPKAKEIHSHITKTGLLPHPYIQNSIILTYAAMSQIHYSRQLFGEMPQRDIAAWNSILSAYADQPNLHFEALTLFKSLPFSGVTIDPVTLVVMLSIFSHWRMLDWGKMVQVYAIKNGTLHGLNLGNALLVFYARNGEMGIAYRWFMEMDSRDLISCTLLINGYIEMGFIGTAQDIFNGMATKDTILWNSMIHGYVKLKRWGEALELFEKMLKMGVVKVDETTVVSMLLCCVNLLHLQLGRVIHRWIVQRNIKMDVFVGMALVDMYAKCGSLEEAMSTFGKLKFRDVFTWTAVIAGHANCRHGKEALSLFLEMQDKGIVSNEATFVAVLKACSHSGMVGEGLFWFDQMVRAHKILPKVEHFGCLIDILGRAGLLCEGERLIKHMRDEDRIIAFKTLLSACISHGEIDIGKKVAKELIKFGPQSHGVYVLSSNFYAFAGCWNDALEMRRIMKGLDLKKEAGISSIEVKS